MRLSLQAQGQNADADAPPPPPRRFSSPHGTPGASPFESPRNSRPTTPVLEGFRVAHPIDSWFVRQAVSREVCEKWLINGNYGPGTFLVSDFMPRRLARSVRI